MIWIPDWLFCLLITALVHRNGVFNHARLKLCGRVLRSFKEYNLVGTMNGNYWVLYICWLSDPWKLELLLINILILNNAVIFVLIVSNSHKLPMSIKLVHLVLNIVLKERNREILWTAFQLRPHNFPNNFLFNKVIEKVYVRRIDRVEYVHKKDRFVAEIDRYIWVVKTFYRNWFIWDIYHLINVIDLGHAIINNVKNSYSEVASVEICKSENVFEFTLGDLNSSNKCLLIVS